MAAVRLLLASECAWLAASYIRGHTYENQRPAVEIFPESQESPDRDRLEYETGGNVFGIGFETDSRMFFWFRKRIEIRNSD